jgi:hypothetical protein
MLSPASEYDAFAPVAGNYGLPHGKNREPR